MAEIFQFPKPEVINCFDPSKRTMIVGTQQQLLVARIPIAFRDEIESVMGGKPNVLDGQNIRAFFEDIIEWAQDHLGITIDNDEKSWLIRLLTHYKDFLALDESIFELIQQARDIRDRVKRGLKFRDLGNKSLMAAGGLAPLKCAQNRDQAAAYYADEASVAYEKAGRDLRDGFLSKLGYEEKPNDLADLIEAFRLLYVCPDFQKLFETIRTKNRRPSQLGPRLCS